MIASKAGNHNKYYAQHNILKLTSRLAVNVNNSPYLSRRPLLIDTMNICKYSHICI